MVSHHLLMCLVLTAGGFAGLARENGNLVIVSAVDSYQVLLLGRAALLAFARFVFPRVLFEPSPVFAAVRPQNFVPGVLDSRNAWAPREFNIFLAEWVT